MASSEARCARRTASRAAVSAWSARSIASNDDADLRGGLAQPRLEVRRGPRRAPPRARARSRAHAAVVERQRQQQLRLPAEAAAAAASAAPGRTAGRPRSGRACSKTHMSSFAALGRSLPARPAASRRCAGPARRPAPPPATEPAPESTSSIVSTGPGAASRTPSASRAWASADVRRLHLTLDGGQVLRARAPRRSPVPMPPTRRVCA